MAGEESTDTGAAGGETTREAAAAATAAKERAEARLLEAQAAQTEADNARKVAEARTKEAEANTKAAEANIKELVAARDKVDAERSAAEAKLAELKAKIGSTNAELATKMNEQADRGLGVRDFVAQSLLEIMAGIDEAAAMGKVRAVDDGVDGFLPAVTRVGATALEENVSERVEFDLAVTLSTSASKQGKQGGKATAGLQVRFLDVAKFQVGASGHIERVTTEATSQDRSNRLKFSVPIVYAVQEASADHE